MPPPSLLSVSLDDGGGDALGFQEGNVLGQLLQLGEAWREEESEERDVH